MREDIQCLRGIAIFLVFIYHLYPTFFVNGFLGVDIFFVISGYLMASNLSRKRIKNVQDILDFYSRRSKRILPLYYLIIFISLILVHLYLAEVWWFPNQRYSHSSLFLVTNHLFIADSGDYFNEFLADGSSLNAFIHLWSLGVEMQFYVLVPFIFFALQFLNNNILKLIAVTITTVLGFICFALINPSFGFNFMLLRLWQFSAGFVAFYWSKIGKSYDEFPEKHSKKVAHTEDMVTIALSVILTCIVPYEIEVLILRPLATFAAAFVIANESQGSKFLRSNSLVYLGNISYTVYLVHWPIIVIFTGFSVKDRLFCTVATLVSSVLFHHLFEKQYLKLSTRELVPLILALFAGNVFLQYSVKEHSFWKPHYTREVQDIVDRNMAFLPNIWEHEPVKDVCIEDKLNYDNIKVLSFCHYPKGTGNLSIMIIGNSYVANLNEHIRAHFNYNYSDYRSYSILSNLGTHAVSSESQIALDVGKKEVAIHKPDVLLLVSRYHVRLNEPMLDDDDLLKEMNENIAFYERFVKKIYILGPQPLYDISFLSRFLHFVTTKPNELDSLHLDKKLAEVQIKYARKRFSMIECQKCHVFDLSHTFLRDDKYLTFDPETMLAHVDNGIHITAAGIKLFEPVFERIAKEIMQNT
ncbi:unnamed protein product [Caenorhabditis sp. 36 PRJEB53466]|nr:unnamed protein product [Caenorhabditis sp. 36 PRJEB53466]